MRTVCVGVLARELERARMSARNRSCVNQLVRDPCRSQSCAKN